MTQDKKTKEDIKKLFDHAKVANEEMSEIKQHIATIQTDVSWIKETLIDTKKALDKFDTRTWVLLSSIILGTLLSIAVSFYKP